jgi:hypothetical protein
VSAVSWLGVPPTAMWSTPFVATWAPTIRPSWRPYGPRTCSDGSRSSSPTPRTQPPLSTFGLVHGAYHGAWCWEQLARELEQRHHRVLTVDLPIEDPNAGARQYAAAAVEAFAAAGDDLVVVGHSLAGLMIPLVASARPVRQMVFLCAMLPRPGRAHNDVQAEEPDMFLPGPEGGAFVDPDGATRWQPDAAASWFYSDCPAAVADWAASRLRGQFWPITEEISPLEAWPSVPSSFVFGVHDPVINPVWSRRAARQILGIDAIEVNAGHSPFLSAPAALAELLAQS